MRKTDVPFNRFGLLGHEDGPHAAFADLLQELVRADLGAGLLGDRLSNCGRKPWRWRLEKLTRACRVAQQYINPLTYKFRKFARRNKVLIGTTAAIAASLIAGIISTTWQAYRATKAERIAENRLATVSRQKDEIAEEKRLAENQAAIAKAVNDFLNSDLLGMADAAAQANNCISRHWRARPWVCCSGRSINWKQPVHPAATVAD